VLFGTVVFTMFGGFYFWWPRFTAKMLNETFGKWHFWTLFLGFHMTFLVQHWLGVEGGGHAVAVATYPANAGFTTLNMILPDRLVHPRCLHPVLPLERLRHLAARREGDRQRPPFSHSTSTGRHGSSFFANLAAPQPGSVHNTSRCARNRDPHWRRLRRASQLQLVV
jgi:hypothetical protein